MADPLFDLPDDDAPAVADLVMLPSTRPLIREPVITPDIDAYLTMLETAVAPFEAAAKAFAEDMASTPIDTPQQLAALGKQSIYAREREQLIEALFAPAIEKPRQYLDRLYAVKRRVLNWWKTGGTTAASRYTVGKRELEDADRRARLEADRKWREAQQAADRKALEERQRLMDQAAETARVNWTNAADLVAQARAIQPEVVPIEAPEPQAAAAAVPGLGERESWNGRIVDMQDAILTAARPLIYREVAAAAEEGELSGGARTITTGIIAHKLRALADELPVIPSSMFAGNEAELRARAKADKDTLRWPGFLFERTQTPVRRPLRG